MIELMLIEGEVILQNINISEEVNNGNVDNNHSSECYDEEEEDEVDDSSVMSY